MRVRDIVLHNTIDPDRPNCGWNGCRDAKDKSKPAAALYHATYEIRTGRTEAGVWVKRKMGLCGPDLVAFRNKYQDEDKTKAHVADLGGMA